jgi:hypothetical protein
MLGAEGLKGALNIIRPELNIMSVLKCSCRDSPCLSPVPCTSESLKFRFVSEKHFYTSSQVWDRGDPSIHIGGYVEGHGHLDKLSRPADSARTTCKLCKVSSATIQYSRKHKFSSQSRLDRGPFL